MNPDLRAFLEKYRPDGFVTFVAIVPDGQTDAATFNGAEPGRVARWIEQRNAHCGCYFTANSTAAHLRKKPLKADIEAIAAVWADIDPRDDQGYTLAQERTRLAALAGELHALDTPPSVTIDSGNGLQPVWLLAEPIEATPEYRDAAEALCGRIEAALGARGTFNVDRLLRLPGTVNLPNKKKRKLGRGETQARLLHATWQRYSWRDLERLAAKLEDEPPVHAVPIPASNGRGSDAEFDLPPDAPEPLEPERLELLRANHPAAFDLARYDGDQSRQDLALATLAARVGWPEIDAWRLIIAVRGDRKAFRRDYVQRTLSRASAEPEPEPEAAQENKAGQSVRPEIEPLVFDPRDPLPIARTFVDINYQHEAGRTLHHHRGEFYAWTGNRYAELAETDIRARLYDFLGKAVRIVDSKAVPFAPDAAKVHNALDALRAVAHLPGSTEAPAWLDGRKGPNPAEILACRNGLLHLPTRRTGAPTPRFFGLNVVEFEYAPDAPAPDAWARFLDSLWGDDAEAIDCLQEIFGHLLTPDTRHQKIILIVGPKRSGKGTIARVLKSLLGNANVAGPTLSGLGTNFGLAPLIGKPLAIISDARLSGRADQHVIAERLLSISGEDVLTIDRKHREAWTGTLPTRFMILTNELPRIADSSGALASRFIVLTLTRSFYGREDHELTARLLGELPGILNWSLQGWARLRDRGRFVQPASSADAIQELDDLGSPIGAFIRERCTVAPGRSVGAQSLYDAWSAWCEAQGRAHSGTVQTFGRDVRAAVPGLKMAHPRSVEGAGRPRTYEGIGLG